MKKKLLLTSFAVLSSIGLANAVCTPPTTLKCACQHPIIENGVLVCGPSYCGDKKCMPDGSCCETEKYCESSVGTQCCAEGQTCDTANGCIEEKADIETLCANAQGTIVTASSGTFCESGNRKMNWFEAEAWCQDNGMTMATMYEMCPSWDGNTGNGKCPELSGTGSTFFWSATTSGSSNAFYADQYEGYVGNRSQNLFGYEALCH